MPKLWLRNWFGSRKLEWSSIWDLMRAVEYHINDSRDVIMTTERARIASRLRWLADNIEEKL